MVYFSQRYSPNCIHLIFCLCVAATVLAGCIVPAPTPRAYTAVVERLDQLPGSYYSPREGPTLRVCLNLRITVSSGHHRGALLRVFLTDLYSQEMHGQHGDLVSFSYPHVFPISGELNFEVLDDYRVVRNG
jgi:hypothetical protein